MGLLRNSVCAVILMEAATAKWRGAANGGKGGFLIKFDGKEVERCYSVSFDYDDWQYVVNGTEKKELPADVKAITIIPERA